MSRCGGKIMKAKYVRQFTLEKYELRINFLLYLFAF